MAEFPFGQFAQKNQKNKGHATCCSKSFGYISNSQTKSILFTYRNKKRLPKESLSKWWARLESNQRCFICHGFTVRCNRQLCLLTRVAESVGHEPNAVLAAHIA